MENKDILFTLALNMELREILNLCKVNKAAQKNICKNQNFWIKKMERDGINDYMKTIDIATDDEVESNISPATFYRYLILGPSFETYKMESPDATTFASVIKRGDYNFTVDLLRQANVDALPQLSNLKIKTFQRKINGIDSYIIPFLRIDKVKRVIAGNEQGNYNDNNIQEDTWNKERGWSDYYGNVLLLDVSTPKNWNNYLYVTGDSIIGFKTIEPIMHLYSHYETFSGSTTAVAITKNLIYTLFDPYSVIQKGDINDEYIQDAVQYVSSRDDVHHFATNKIL